MSLKDQIQIVPADADVSRLVPPPPSSPAPKAEQAGPTPEQLAERNAALSERLAAMDELLAKPLKDILAEHEKAGESALAWDRYGAMWMLSQRAMRRVAMDLGAQLGVSEQEIVARAMAHANAVLNGADEEDLGGSIAPAQMAHIARHKAFLRSQFRGG
jgi:cell division septum initiation protein DivIVA